MVWDDNNGTDWITSSLNEYLNNDYYTNLSEEAKEQIIKHIWNIGAIKSDNLDLAEQIITEKSNQYSANVGLITVSEYIMTNSNINNCGSLQLLNQNISNCRDNWMYGNSFGWWTITTSSTDQKNVFYIIGDAYGAGGIVLKLTNSLNTSIRPSLYRSSEIKIITGDGSQNFPYGLSN